MEGAPSLDESMAVLARITAKYAARLQLRAPPTVTAPEVVSKRHSNRTSASSSAVSSFDFCEDVPAPVACPPRRPPKAALTASLAALSASSKSSTAASSCSPFEFEDEPSVSRNSPPTAETKRPARRCVLAPKPDLLNGARDGSDSSDSSDGSDVSDFGRHRQPAKRPKAAGARQGASTRALSSPPGQSTAPPATPFSCFSARRLGTTTPRAATSVSFATTSLDRASPLGCFDVPSNEGMTEAVMVAVAPSPLQLIESFDRETLLVSASRHGSRPSSANTAHLALVVNKPTTHSQTSPTPAAGVGVAATSPFDFDDVYCEEPPPPPSTVASRGRKRKFPGVVAVVAVAAQSRPLAERNAPVAPPLAAVAAVVPSRPRKPAAASLAAVGGAALSKDYAWHSRKIAELARQRALFEDIDQNIRL